MARYKTIRSAIHNFAHSFCSTLNYVVDGYGIDHVTSAAHEARASQAVIKWVRDGQVLEPVEVEPREILNSRVRQTLAIYSSRWPGLLRSMDLSLGQFRRIDMRLEFDWSMPYPFGPLRLTMEAEDDRGKEYEVPVTDFIQPHPDDVIQPEPTAAAEPASAGRRWAPAFLRWFGLGVYVAFTTVLPSALRG